MFVEGAVWDINSFDQWGVELGKELASRLAPIVADPAASAAALDASTAGLIAHLRELRARRSERLLVLEQRARRVLQDRKLPCRQLLERFDAAVLAAGS